MDPIASLNEPRLSTPRKPRAEFSYATAAAALEKGAGQSLKTFGARPAPAAGAPPSASVDRPANAPSTPATSSAEAPPAIEAQDRRATPAPLSSASPMSRTPVDTTTAATARPNASLALVADHGLAPPGVAGGPPPVRAGVVADGGASKTEPAIRSARPAALAEPRAVRSPAEFAQLIARRLEDSSEFELRLDPPELGRIEAKLVMGDSGAAQLTITFDNQAAYDLFARDDAALRLAFAAAGYSFGGDGLAFVLDEVGKAAPGDDPASPASASPYAAALTTVNAIDLRV